MLDCKVNGFGIWVFRSKIFISYISHDSSWLNSLIFFRIRHFRDYSPLLAPGISVLDMGKILSISWRKYIHLQNKRVFFRMPPICRWPHLEWYLGWDCVSASPTFLDESLCLFCGVIVHLPSGPFERKNISICICKFAVSVRRGEFRSYITILNCHWCTVKPFIIIECLLFFSRMYFDQLKDNLVLLFMWHFSEVPPMF